MQKKSGFSFVEVIIVIAILGVMIAVALPKLDFFGRKSAYITARQLVSDLRYTRTLAVTSGARHYLKFLPPGGTSGKYTSYEIYEDAVSPVKIGDTKTIFNKVSCSTTLEEIKISYMGVGTAGDGLITLSDENQTYKVSFNAATGRAYEYKD